MPLILSAAQVRDLLDMREAIDACAQALAELSAGQAVMPVRSTTTVAPHAGAMLSMPAYLSRSDALGSKIVTVYARNPQRGLPTILAVVVVNDPETGQVLAIMDGAYLTAVRTAAASGVATRYLATPGPKVLGILGAGVQGQSHLWAMREVAQVTRCRIYNRTRAKAEAFQREMEPRLGVPIDVVDSEEAAVRGADLVVLATTAAQPIVRWEWFGPGCHINAVGSHAPGARELDTETVARARVVVDSRDAIFTECGDILVPLQEGRITRAQVADELGEVIGGTKPGRTHPGQVTLFKSVGVAVEDVATATLVYRKAVARGVGTRVDL
ncbi:MAG: ornithine cyclodeaminase family protein [Armatimonadota bacterium]|nr:ornithine cyclodeaminase family protein [Armatimonadota bacterium]MDR7532484.1 ornithine cyclodeaminase family protein [Armatimonadota bacterium]MDR7535625.1 ornithine cyclodeaminase family protein [Armatimonadota bacterium]